MEQQQPTEPEPPLQILCGICYQVYGEDNQPVRFKACRHQMCAECEQKLRQRNCPFCRTPIAPGDVTKDQSFWDLMKLVLSHYFTNSGNTKRVLQARIPKLTPTLENMLKLRKEIIADFTKAIEQIESSRNWSAFSLGLKTGSGVCALIPVTAPFGVAALAITSVVDLGITLDSITTKGEIYDKINATVARHDEIATSAKIAQLYYHYRLYQQERDFVERLMNVRNQTVQPHTTKMNLHRASEVTISCSIAATTCISAYKVGAELECGSVVANIAGGAKQLSKTTKVIVGVGVLLEWGLFWLELQEGRKQMDDLRTQIKLTKDSVDELQEFINQLKELQNS